MPFVSVGPNISNSAQIEPGTIVNSDINASAAIEATKIQEVSVGVNGGVLPSTGLVNAHVAAAAAIAFSKLAALTRGGVLVGSVSDVATVLAPGTAGKFLQTNGAGADPTWETAGASEALASNTQQFAADTVRNDTNTSFAVKKAITVRYPGTYRVKWESQGVGSPDTDTRVYVNNTAWGVSNRNSTNNYVAYSEDLYIPAGAVIQLYAMRTGGTSYNVKNFRICFTKQAISVDGVVITD